MPSPDLVVQFNPELYNVSESGGTVTLSLETDKQFEYPFTVEVNTADGTAVGEVHVHSVWIYNLVEAHALFSTNRKNVSEHHT